MNTSALQYLFTSPEGRIGRQSWWLGVLILIAISLVLTMILGVDGAVSFLVNIIMAVAGIMLHIKRFHDRGKSGWWVLILFVPLLGLIWAIVDLGILAGSEAPNRYGAPRTASSPI